LAIGASFFSSPPTSASVVAGAGAFKYDPISFASAAFHDSTPSTTISLPSPKSPSALQAATTSSPVVSAADRSWTVSGWKRRRSRSSARSILGRSVPASR